jgi:mono/diheme cytochrome c family protein
MTNVLDTASAALERKLPTEDADVAQIVQGILTVQAQFAADEHRPLARGTHAKGICALAVFEVFDVHQVIADKATADRLGVGLFAQPGVYPAIIRFANGDSQINSDRKHDVRALSFSIDLPPAAVGDLEPRQDFALNNASTFPINDAHAFAVLMRVLTAPSRFRAFRELSFSDQLGFLRTGIQGVIQQNRRVQPYQLMQYWSTVPFRLGSADAVKYTAIPNPANPASSLQHSTNALQNELARHLSDDVQMSSFDFGLQLLDVDRMTHLGRRREASYWVENASVDWNESQSPFHIVGRLTLTGKSLQPLAAAETMYIDVTQHAAGGLTPIGSINRARWAAESASRNARMAPANLAAAGQPQPPAASEASGSAKAFALRAARVAAALALALGLAAVLGTMWAFRAADRNIPAVEHVDEVRYLDQGWGFERESPSRETYYYTPQGASIHGVRYSWFVNLERLLSGDRFADPDHMRSLGFIVEPVPTHANPDQLPIGFGKRFDPSLNDYVVDVTCAACHNGQLNITRHGKTTAIRIDGGAALNAFTDMQPGHFSPVLVMSLLNTYFSPFKFNRFARRVLGPDHYAEGKAKLAADLWSVIKELGAVAWPEIRHGLYPTQEGFGRTDALARIGNTVFGDHLDARNYRVGNAPVSFPYVWNIWKFDWVQYNASVSQPMARNVGEAMGTGATYEFLDSYGRPLPAAERYRTSISFDNLLTLESTLQMLKPPRWPEDLLGPIDQAKAARGKALFEQHCIGCHGPHVAADALTASVSPLRRPGEPLWVIRWKDVQDVGTDPNAAMNFVNNRVDMSRTGLELDEVRQLLRKELEMEKARQANLVPALQQELARRKAAGADAATVSEIEEEIEYAHNYLTEEKIARSLDALDLRAVPVGQGLNIFGLIVRDRYYKDNRFSSDARACYEGFGMLDLPQIVPGYKPRPLEGVWATPPFLHNGSVPNLYELLSPVAERSKTFRLGHREFDPVKVGYASEPGDTRGFVFDATLPGNSNRGHEFREGYVPFDESKPASLQYQGGAIGPALAPEQRYDIIEYLKVKRDDPGRTETPRPADCSALLKASR